MHQHFKEEERTAANRPPPAPLQPTRAKAEAAAVADRGAIGEEVAVALLSRECLHGSERGAVQIRIQTREEERGADRCRWTPLCSRFELLMEEPLAKKGPLPCCQESTSAAANEVRFKFEFKRAKKEVRIGAVGRLFAVDSNC